MLDKQAARQSGSNLSTSDLSDPPNSQDDEVYGEIHVKLTTPPPPISQNQESITEDSIPVLPESNGPSSSRPTRATRNVRPARYSGSDDEILAEAEEPLPITNQRVPAKRSNTDHSPDAVVKKPPAKRARPTPRAKKSKWDPNYVTENEKSPLVKVDLRVCINASVRSVNWAVNSFRSLYCCSLRHGTVSRRRTGKRYWR